jgi:hypothetical protein
LNACKDDKDDGIPTSQIEGMKIGPGTIVRIDSCGREDAASGTEGDLEIWEDGAGGAKVGHFYWDCPWGTRSNTWTVSGMRHSTFVYCIHPNGWIHAGLLEQM